MKTFDIEKLTFKDLKDQHLTPSLPTIAARQFMKELPQADKDGVDIGFIGDEAPAYPEFAALIIVAEIGDEPVFALMLYWLRACHGRKDDVNEFLGCLRGVLDRVKVRGADMRADWIIALELKWMSYVSFCEEKEKAKAQKAATSEQVEETCDCFFSASKHYVTVVEQVGGADGRDGKDLQGRYGAIIGKKVPVQPVTVGPETLQTKLTEKFPWAPKAVNTLVGDIATKLKFGNTKLSGCLRPVLLVGPAGCGKTTMLTEIAELLGLPSTLLPCGGSQDSGGLLPVARGWSTAKPCGPFERIHADQIANPVIILDEIEKVGPIERANNGSLHGALLSMMNGNGRYYDACLQANVDLSYVNFWATANSLAGIPEPLVDRFNVIEVPAPGAKHASAILDGVIANEAKFLGAKIEALPKPSTTERKLMAAELTNKGGSIRAVQRAYRVWLAEKAMPKHDVSPEDNCEAVVVVPFDRRLH